MKTWPRIISFVGICCSSLCFLSLPLAAFLVPYGFGWLHNETLTRVMLLMFLAMSMAGTVGAFLTHRRRGPGICAFLGSGLLAGTAWRLFPPPIGWLSVVLLLAAWIWDWLLTRGNHHEHMASHA